MIKFLHTADLHLGKLFYDHNLCEDQSALLDDLACILNDGSYSALVIAGDVYDRSIPSPEAVELFGDFLVKVKSKQPSLEILVIPGNHDSALRLGFGRELFARLGIRFAVNAADCDKPVIIKKDGESCAFFLLPFLNSGALEGADPVSGELVPLRSQSALAAEAALRIETARKSLTANGVSRHVLAAHLFAFGGAETDSERVFLGSAELVNLSLFKGFDYIALGHLHRCQKAGENAWYSGSPLVYSFGEISPEGDSDTRKQQEKFFLSVTLNGGTTVEKIPVKPKRRVTSFSGPFIRFTGDLSADPELLAAQDDYVEIRLTDRGITENAREILRKRFPRLLSLRQDEARFGLSQLVAAHTQIMPRGERRSLSADFRDFITCLYGDINTPEIIEEIELFEALLAETETGEDV